MWSMGKNRGKVSRNFYPPQFLHSLIYRITLPSVFKNKKEARLRFVSGYSIQFDTFPDYAFYEVIPLIWDCWPKQVESVAAFFRKHQVKRLFLLLLKLLMCLGIYFPKWILNCYFCFKRKLIHFMAMANGMQRWHWLG